MLSLAAPEASAQTGSQTAAGGDPDAVCGSIGSHEIMIEGWRGEIRVRNDQGTYLQNDGGGVRSFPITITDANANPSGCDVVVDTNEMFNIPFNCQPEYGTGCVGLRIQASPVVVFEFGHTTPAGWVMEHSFTYGLDYGGPQSLPRGCANNPDSFYCPNQTSGVSPDTGGDYYVYYDASRDLLRFMPDNLGGLCGNGKLLCATTPVRFLDEFFPDSWVMPYEFNAVCAIDPSVSGCTAIPGTFRDNFMYPGSSSNPSLNPTYRFSGIVDVLRPAGTTSNWTIPGLRLEFPTASRLVVEGTLNATGTTFAAADPARGWSGILYRRATGSPTAVSTLSGVTVSGARTFLPPWVALADEEPIGAAVTVANRAVIVTGISNIVAGATPIGGPPVTDGTVYPTNGVQVIGTGSLLTITGGSKILNHGGVGVLATGGGIASVTSNSLVSLNRYGGVRATGFRSNIGVFGFARVDNNFGAGVRADQQGFVSVRTAGGSQLNTSASNNRGGLYARSGGSISGEQCDGTGNARRPNAFLSNYIGDDYDATALGASVVSARYAFWGNGRTTLDTLKDNSSTLALYPRAPNANTQQPFCDIAYPDNERSAGTPGMAAVAYWDDDAAPQAARGQVSDAIVALAAQAREAGWAGNTDAAFATLAAARTAVVTTDDREAVFEAMASLLANERPADVVADLEAAAAAPGADRAWAQRALAVAYATGGHAADAEALAATLASSTDAGHAAYGHAFGVRLAADAGDEAVAMARLSDFAAVVTEDGAEALGSAVALVAATFPDADLSAILGSAPAGRGTAGRGHAGAATAAGKDSPAANAAASTLDVFPNPSASGQAALRVTLAESAAHAVATVYDALGRRVAVLHDGALAAGAHTFALGTLAPGMYVVHVRASTEAGAVWTDVRRVTVTR